MNIINIFITSFLIENVILTKFLGICPLIGSSNNTKKALGMGITVTIVTVISSICLYLINKYILIPTNTTYLITIIAILIIASIVQILQMIIKNKFKNLFMSFGIYLPLVTTNCAVLGTVLLGINNNYNLIEFLFFSLGSSLGFLFILYVFSAIRMRLQTAKTPSCFKNYPIALITIAIITLIFTRYI